MLHTIKDAFCDALLQTSWILFCLGFALVVIKITDVISERRKRAKAMRSAELRNTANREAKRQAAKNDAAWSARFGNTR